MTTDPLEAEWMPLLQRMLACLRRSRETPLQFEIDSDGIVSAALADLPVHRARNFDSVGAVLNQLVNHALREAGIDELDVESHAQGKSASARSFSTWLEK